MRADAPPPDHQPGRKSADGRGWTPREIGRWLRVSPDQVRAWILAHELDAINTARNRCGRPRYIILPHQLEEFCHRRAAAAAPKPARRRRAGERDWFPDIPD
jgi:hypothetical protein